MKNKIRWGRIFHSDQESQVEGQHWASACRDGGCDDIKWSQEMKVSETEVGDEAEHV